MPSIGHAIGVALERFRPRGRLGQDLQELRNRAASLAEDADARRLLELLDDISDYAVRRGSSGLLLVLDEASASSLSTRPRTPSVMTSTCYSALLRLPRGAATAHSSS